MGRNARPSFKRVVKPDGRNRLLAKNYACNTCGREPYQCWDCGQLTCHSCTTASPPKCDHCQRPPKAE